jgi:3-hydroxybutyryl-CoA dehydratase
MRFSDLTPGYEFPSTALALDAETVARYLLATQDDHALYWREGAVHVVPPLAVAALAFRGIAQELALAPGSLHTGQELLFRRLVTVGERLTAQAHVAASSRRRGFVALVVDLAATDDLGETALSGSGTLLVAGAQDGDAARTGHVTSTPPVVHVRETAAPGPVANPPRAPSARAVGRELGSLVRTVTQERIDQYAAASGDYNPIHVDPAFAAQSPFGGTVAHGMLLLAYLSTLLTRAFGHAWLRSGALKVKFRQPAPAGATVMAQGRVERLEEGHGVQYAVCALRLEDAAGEALIIGDARVDVKEVP